MVRALLIAGVIAASTLHASAAPLAIDKANSQFQVAVKATVDSFTATLGDYDIKIDVNSASQTVTAGTLTFHFSDIRTGNEKRDVEMNTWQETARFPDVRFEFQSAKILSPGVYTLTGKVTFHGVTQELTFPITLSVVGPAVKLDGTVSFDTRTFGLPVIRKYAFLKVDPSVTVHFHLVGTLTAS